MTIRFPFANAALALLALGAASACTETPITVPLRSLERSGEVSFVCAGPGGVGRDIDSCPDFDGTGEDRQLLALVTQTLRGEVAVINLSAGEVVDVDPSTPGYNFLPVGQNPVDIVSTPGGVASFVGVAAVGKEGIFALPTTCARPPAHDIVAWPACSLPSAPGEMAIAIDPADAAGGIRQSCDSSDYLTELPAPLAADRADCAADLRAETNPPGRRKLVVTLPDLGGFAVIDAQDVLDREPGSYQPCTIEQWVPLDPTAPAGEVKQTVPPDLVAPGCTSPEINYGPKPSQFVSRPAGIAMADDRLFVSDLGAPQVHVYDLSDPCFPSAAPPLLPVAFEARGRTVTTRDVAISPTTTKGERFAYVIDDFDGSIMAFDVTPGASERTPIVRPGAPLLPFEPADRIAFNSPARDITFAVRDLPIVDPDTGVASIGTFCSPDPSLDPKTDPAARHRTALDYSSGAAPRRLRGVFGFAALASGQVAVIDVEDWDAPCRRPVSTNSAAIEDFRGCSGDPDEPEEYRDSDGNRTVSGEVSCHVVEPHRARSGNLLVSNEALGVRGPSLKKFPRLSSEEGGNLPVDQTEEAKQYPKMLAVDYVDPEGGTLPAEVFINTERYASSGGDAENELILDPGLSQRLSLALIQREPRSFADGEYSASYEGTLTNERPAGFLRQCDADDVGVLPECEPSAGVQLPFVVWADADANFCNRGVEDADLARDVGASMGVASEDLSSFARRHADVVQISNELRAQDNGYWDQVQCGGETGDSAFFLCRNTFGTADSPSDVRDLRVLEAYQDRLVVEPRKFSKADQQAQALELMACCFGGSALKYKLRAGNQWVIKGENTGFRHNVIADDNLRCIRDCSPRRALLKSRAYEISSSTCQPAKQDEFGECAIGPATTGDVACVVDNQSPVTPASSAAACIFDNINFRMAFYRGNRPSVRDMSFTWEVSGAFSPLTANLLTQSAAVIPQSMTFVPQIGQLAVVDGAAEGLVFINLDSVAVSRLYF